MILYNLTVRVDHDIEQEWLEYVRKKYVLSVMATELFFDFKIYRLLNEPDNEGITYALQFFAHSMNDVEKYLNNYAHAISEDHRLRFRNKHVAFNTLLESLI